MAASSILSAGEIVRSILAEDETIAATVTAIYPIVVNTATLPYIVYRRIGLEQVAVKGSRGADKAQIEVDVYTEGYTEGVELAEAVRDALDNATGSTDDLVMRSCLLTDAQEGWQDDAYIQQLVFEVRI